MKVWGGIVKVDDWRIVHDQMIGNECITKYVIKCFTSWPLVGNEGMNPQYTNVKVDSLIPY